MKISTLKLFLLGMVMLSGVGGAMACDLSSISLCGIGAPPSTPLLNPAFPNDSVICITVCNGYGRTGASKGADNDTRSISFGWYTHRIPPVTPTGFIIRAFTPAQVTSGRGFSNCTMPGSNIGPAGPPYNSQGTILFTDPGYFNITPCVSQPFGCVGLTSQCGPRSQQCVTYRFQVNKIPDSVRVFGVEGGGNPIAGCYPDADMMLNFVPTAVEWGAVETEVTGRSVVVEWTTLIERNTDLFLIERMGGNSNFLEIGSVPAAGNSASSRKYTFTDLSPNPGNNTYRVVQVDKEGHASNSPLTQVNFTMAPGMNWGAFGPNPATDHVNMTYYNDRTEPVTLTVYDLGGNTVMQQELQSINGANAVRLALDAVDAGAYFVRLQGSGAKLTRKIVKL